MYQQQHLLFMWHNIFRHHSDIYKTYQNLFLTLGVHILTIFFFLTRLRIKIGICWKLNPAKPIKSYISAHESLYKPVYSYLKPYKKTTFTTELLWGLHLERLKDMQSIWTRLFLVKHQDSLLWFSPVQVVHFFLGPHPDRPSRVLLRESILETIVVFDVLLSILKLIQRRLEHLQSHLPRDNLLIKPTAKKENEKE